MAPSTVWQILKSAGISPALCGTAPAGQSPWRTRAGAQRGEELIAYLAQVIASENLTADGFGDTLLQAHKAGQLPVEAAIGLLAGYVVAAFDTTISTIASGVWLFAPSRSGSPGSSSPASRSGRSTTSRGGSPTSPSGSGSQSCACLGSSQL